MSHYITAHGSRYEITLVTVKKKNKKKFWILRLYDAIKATELFIKGTRKKEIGS